jgi:hypothetical protein
MININLTQLTNIIFKNLVSLCSCFGLDMPNIFDFIFTCFVFSVSLPLIYFASLAGRWVLVNGRWVWQAIVTGAVGGATNAGVQRLFPGPSAPGGGGNNGSGNNNPGNNAPGGNNPESSNPGDKTPGENNPGDKNPGDKAPSDNKPVNNNPGDTGNNKPGNTDGNTGGKTNTEGNKGGNTTTGSSS